MRFIVTASTQTIPPRRLENHPDKGGDAAKFQKISEAYSVLSDPEKRRDYDRGGPALMGAFPGRAGVDPFELFKTFFGRDDPFDDLFGSTMTTTVVQNGRVVTRTVRTGPGLGTGSFFRAYNIGRMDERMEQARVPADQANDDDAFLREVLERSKRDVGRPPVYHENQDDDSILREVLERSRHDTGPLPTNEADDDADLRAAIAMSLQDEAPSTAPRGGAYASSRQQQLDALRRRGLS